MPAMPEPGSRPAAVAGRNTPQRTGTLLDYLLIGLLTGALIVILLVFFRDQVATILAWITGLIG